jgi:membrane-bound ClpP family serine protease
VVCSLSVIMQIKVLIDFLLASGPFKGEIQGAINFLPVQDVSPILLNWFGILLILAAVAAFIGEFFTGGIGLLFAAGLVSLVVGVILISEGGLIVFHVDPWVLAVVIIVIGGFVALSVNRIVHTYHRQATTGKEDAMGKKALVKKALDLEGVVLFEGELWTAESESGRIEPGEEAIVTKVEGLKLWVKKK